MEGFMDPSRFPLTTSFQIIKLVGLSFVLFVSSALASTIGGFVYGANKTPLSQVDVELLNENYQLRGKTLTDGAGRYTFPGLSDGRYTVRVLPFRYDMEDMEIGVEIYTVNVRGSGQGNAYISQDFFLRPKHGGLTAAEIAAVVFAQEVPEDARRLYQTAVSDLSSDRRVDGIRGLRNAISIFPNYYDANFLLGKLLLVSGENAEAAQLLIKAAGINPKSAMSLYYAGSALHNLGADYDKGALVALNEALKLAPSSVQVLFLLGKVERRMKDFTNAEKHLVQARKLTKQPIAEIHKELAQLYGNDLKKFDLAASELESYLKASKLTPEEEQKTKQVIASLRQKSKTPPSN